MKFPLELPANKDRVPIFPLQTFLLTQSDSDCLIFLLSRIFFDLLFEGFTKESFSESHGIPNKPTLGCLWTSRPYINAYEYGMKA